jgi:iron-sulfur cluster assembly accessory protein
MTDIFNRAMEKEQTTTLNDAPVISLTADAAEHIKEMQSEQAEHAGKPLRIYVESGGCSGFQYGMTFDEQRDKDLVADFSDVQLVVDPVSADYLKGTVIDFKDTLNDGGFKISNPKAKQSCGCGRSFET